MNASQNLRDLMVLRRASVTLSPYLERVELRAEESMCLEGVCRWKGKGYRLKMRADGLLKRLTSELIRLEPGILGGRIRVEDVKALIIALYLPASTLAKNLDLWRQVKKSAGLIKDKKLRNKAISAKILAGQILRRGRILAYTQD